MKINCKPLHLFRSNFFKIRFYSDSHRELSEKTTSEKSSYTVALQQLEKFDPQKKQITPFPAAKKYQEKFKQNHLVSDLDWLTPKPLELFYGSGKQNHTAPAIYVT